MHACMLMHVTRERARARTIDDNQICKLRTRARARPHHQVILNMEGNTTLPSPTPHNSLLPTLASVAISISVKGR